jgi:hypothetical protein
MVIGLEKGHNAFRLIIDTHQQTYVTNDMCILKTAESLSAHYCAIIPVEEKKSSGALSRRMTRKRANAIGM